MTRARKQDYEIAIENVLSSASSPERKAARLRGLIAATERQQAELVGKRDAQILTPGEYRRLDAACTEAISAAREALSRIEGSP